MRQVELKRSEFAAEVGKELARDVWLWWDGLLVGIGILAAAAVLVAAVWACVHFM